jgi:CMP-2-keto-3-deoxyoctulosonic acid synthetase
MSAQEGQNGRLADVVGGPTLTDAVEKVSDDRDVALYLSFSSLPLGRMTDAANPTPETTDIHATHMACAAGGGGQTRFARVLRFCTIAARWNSSRAPERPRRRIRSK